MCGIVGTISNKKKAVNLELLLDKINHRGPDNTGVIYWEDGRSPIKSYSEYQKSNVSFGHKRLSIIDLSKAASQPFSSEDGKWWITYNGEVYNYLEIKEELKKEGIKFKTSSDTEVVLAAIILWGINTALKRFQGMFAFALLNTDTGDVFLARDAFGIKPLFYCEWESGIAFASEIKSLKALPDIDKSLNAEGVSNYLINGGIDYGDQTLLNGIKQFIPGTWGITNIKSDILKISFKTYWDPRTIIKKEISFADAVRNVRTMFLSNVKIHLRSDVNFGVALSGGLDSSAIVCCIRHLYPDLPIHTFSFVPSEQNISEEYYIDKINKHIGAIPHKIKIEKEDIISDFEKLINLQDEPFGSLSIYSQYRVFKAASETGIKVMLDGQGADELMGGYSWLQGFRLASLIHNRSFVRAFKFVINQKKWSDRTSMSVLFTGLNQIFSGKKYAFFKSIFKNKIDQKYLNKDWFDKNKVVLNNFDSVSEGPDYLHCVLKKSITQGLLNLLRYEDRNSMAHSLESRVPFLTTQFAELVLSLPEEYLINDEGGSKVVFREAMRGIVPDEILDRKEKKGFATPDYLWLNTNHKFIEKLVNSSIPIECLIKEETKNSITKSINNYENYSPEKWRLINFAYWMNLNNLK